MARRQEEPRVAHTPGPWGLREVDGIFAMAHARGWVMEADSDEQNRADWRLITASPEMLEVIEEMLEQASGPCGLICGDTYDKASEIVKRAKGE